MPGAGGPAVARVLERVTATARRHDMLSPGDLVLASVSGGPDSVCLLHALHRLRGLFRVELAVLHVDHRLRPDSARDAAYVRRQAGRLGLVFHLKVAKGGPAKGQSVEAWARGARLRAENDVREEIAPDRPMKVALGHTVDDQAETVLMAALRGEGLEGVAGIRPNWLGRIHPLLDVTREEVEAFCRALGLRPRRDPTNLDPRFLRNALRLHGIPALERATGRNVREPLARTGALLWEDARELDRQAKMGLAGAVRDRGASVELHAERLLSLPRPIASRLVGLALLRFVLPTREHVEAVLDLAGRRPGRRRTLPGGLMAAREREYVRLSRPSPEKPVS